MKGIRRSFFLIILIMALVFKTYHYKIYTKKIKIQQTVELKNGESVGSVLEEVGIKYDVFIKVFLKTTGISKNMKAGHYQLEKEYTIAEFFNVLKKGQFKMIKVTIPEGFTVKQIKKLLISKKIMTGEEFDKTLKEVEFPYITHDNNYEGYFFPETYSFAKGSKPKIVIETILEEFLKRFPVKKHGKNEKAKVEFYDKLILASIIEREAILSKEKPVIASVFYNRLKDGMRLQSDATINYIFNYEKKRIYYKDLEIKSPYNTYRNSGLPPTPIGNPGELAIKASLNPDHTDYYYFVATYDGTNSHHFTKTYKEHINYQNQNKNKPK